MRTGAPGGSRPATSAGLAGTRMEGGPGGDTRLSCPAPRPAQDPAAPRHSPPAPRGRPGTRFSQAGGGPAALPTVLGNCFSSSVPAGRTAGAPTPPGAGHEVRWILFLSLKAHGRARSFTGKVSLKFSHSA